LQSNAPNNWRYEHQFHHTKEEKGIELAKLEALKEIMANDVTTYTKLLDEKNKEIERLNAICSNGREQGRDHSEMIWTWKDTVLLLILSFSWLMIYCIHTYIERLINKYMKSNLEKQCVRHHCDDNNLRGIIGISRMAQKTSTGENRSRSLPNCHTRRQLQVRILRLQRRHTSSPTGARSIPW